MDANKERKIIQISSCSETVDLTKDKTTSVLFALCDDNTIWVKKGNLRKWIKVINVPETEEKDTVLGI